MTWLTGIVKISSRLTLWIASFLLLFAGSANAISIDCATAGCLGGSYTLDVVSNGGNSYTATYKIDTTGSYSVSATALNDAEFKVANNYTNIMLVSGPAGTTGAGPLGGRGPIGSNASFIDISLSPTLSLGNTYEWQVSFDSTSLLDDSEWHVGARYTSATHRNGWVISETSSPVPEPTSALLFGAGLVTVGTLTRRRSR